MTCQEKYRLTLNTFLGKNPPWFEGAQHSRNPCRCPANGNGNFWLQFMYRESEEEPPKEDNMTETVEVKLDDNFDVPVSNNKTDSVDIKEPIQQITFDKNKTLNGP